VGVQQDDLGRVAMLDAIVEADGCLVGRLLQARLEGLALGPFPVECLVRRDRLDGHEVGPVTRGERECVLEPATRGAREVDGDKDARETFHEYLLMVMRWLRTTCPS